VFCQHLEARANCDLDLNNAMAATLHARLTSERKMQTGIGRCSCSRTWRLEFNRAYPGCTPSYICSNDKHLQLQRTFSAAVSYLVYPLRLREVKIMLAGEGCAFCRRRRPWLKLTCTYTRTQLHALHCHP